MEDHNPKQNPGEDLPGTRPDDYNFTPEILDNTVIAIPLLRKLKEEKKKLGINDKGLGWSEEGDIQHLLYDVIIDINLGYVNKGNPPGKKREGAITRIKKLIKEIKLDYPLNKKSTIKKNATQYSKEFVFAKLHGHVIEELVKRDNDASEGNTCNKAIHRIWPDFEVKAFLTRSITTVKADAAHASFSASGKDITWAVIDSGIDKTHKHFDMHNNIHPIDSYHQDFTGGNNPLKDEMGHGTHVAGIIAGEVMSEKDDITVVTRRRDEKGNISYSPQFLKRISGVAPSCKLVSFKVLDENGNGLSSSLIAAISAIQEINGYGRDIKIHGVNMSLGYDFQPEWFACGQSPLCVEVDRLVKTGVVVVVAAGNTGYGIAKSAFRGDVATGLPLSINDPGNADLAITVGSTHRDMPHTYGVSYFSSKGPTGDGRIKPDLVAPGEKIISCAAGSKRDTTQKHTNQTCHYVEDSGTSMAAPHVSGAIASFLSIRREFIGKPEQVKEIFNSTATDLKRDRYFQGHGLIDLMRAIQSI